MEYNAEQLWLKTLNNAYDKCLWRSNLALNWPSLTFQDDFDNMRPLCYPGTDVIVICFSVIHPTSLSNVKEKWLPEMRKHLPKVPIVLVGTKIDLRSSVDVLVDLARYRWAPKLNYSLEHRRLKCRNANENFATSSLMLTSLHSV